MEKLLKAIFRYLLYFKGYQLHRVVSSEEEKAVIAFSNAILALEGYPDDYLNMLSKYYRNSVLFVIHHKKNLIGSIRLYDPLGPCRILDFWNLNFPSDIPLSEYREMGSLVIDKAYRGKSRWAMTALLDIAYSYSKQHGINWWFASAYSPKYEKFRKMNPSCRIMKQSEPTEHQISYRELYSDFFSEAESAVLFVFDLRKASYLHQFRRMLKQKRKRKKRNNHNWEMNYNLKRGF